MIEYDIRRDLLEKATQVTPGIAAPTIAPLNDPDWVAVKAMARRKGINEIMDRLSELGAKGIVASPLRACRL